MIITMCDIFQEDLISKQTFLSSDQLWFYYVHKSSMISYDFIMCTKHPSPQIQCHFILQIHCIVSKLLNTIVHVQCYSGHTDFVLKPLYCKQYLYNMPYVQHGFNLIPTRNMLTHHMRSTLHIPAHHTCTL